MPNPARPRRMDADHTRHSRPFVFVVTFGPGRWPRVPPWRPRLPSPPPPRIALPAPIVPDAGAARPGARPALSPNSQTETAS